MELDTCDAYTAFKGSLDKLRGTYTMMNPIHGKVSGPEGPLHDNPPSEGTMDILRGAMVKSWALWEKYVHDLLKEAHERLSPMWNYKPKVIYSRLCFSGQQLKR